jgi:hypothetical protein
MRTLTELDVITHTIDPEYISLIISNAKKAEIGGKSQFRNRNDRINSLNEDQLVGQISTFCGSIILTGSPEGYISAREKANKNPTSGDGGVDIIGLSNIDIKGSLMRYSMNPLSYRLLVRPRERHDNWIYVLGLVPKERPYKCHLVGWAKDSDLPSSTYNGEIKALHGAYVIDAINLRRINDLIKEIKNV